MDDLRHDAVTDGAADGLLSRRTINLGAAWSVPVVLAAVAAPAVTASSGATLGTSSAEKGEAVASNRKVNFTLVFTGVTGTNKVVVTDISAGGPWQSLPTPEFTVTAESPAVFFTLLRPDNNASLLNITVSYTVNGVAASTVVSVKNQIPQA